MIAMLHGQIIEKNLNSVIIDVQGVGYEVQISNYDYDQLLLESEVKLFTYHHIREQSQELYGFINKNSKFLFEQLITVQGIGPKAGLAILSIGDFESVRSAIARGDSKYIQQANGVGKKTAERVVVDLSDKVGVPSKMSAEFVQTEVNLEDEAIEALISLGFTTSDAIKALEKIDSNLSTEERIRLALKAR